MHFFQHFLKTLFFSKFCKIWKNFVHSSVHAVHIPVSHMYTCTPKIGGTPEYNFLQFFANFLQKIFRNFNLRFSHNQGGFGTGVKIFCKFSLFCIFRKHISLGGKTPKKRVCKKRNEMAFFWKKNFRNLHIFVQNVHGRFFGGVKHGEHGRKREFLGQKSGKLTSAEDQNRENFGPRGQKNWQKLTFFGPSMYHFAHCVYTHFIPGTHLFYTTKNTVCTRCAHGVRTVSTGVSGGVTPENGGGSPGQKRCKTFFTKKFFWSFLILRGILDRDFKEKSEFWGPTVYL